MSSVDFIALARNAYASEPAMADLDALWSAVYKLEHWLFLMTPESTKRGQPSVQSIDGKAWLLVFTDSELLYNYAKQNKNLDEIGNSLYLSMNTAQVTGFLKQYENTELFGVRFNEGAEHGWFSPLRNLQIFPDYLKNKGLL
jgi:hypothetical protein